MNPRQRLTKLERARMAVAQGGLCGCGCKQKLKPSAIGEHVYPLAIGGESKPDALFNKACAEAKTNGFLGDKHRIAKVKRLKNGNTQYDKRKRAGGSRLKSRGFNKSMSKKMDGSVVKMAESEIIVAPPVIAPALSYTPMEMLGRALERGADLSVLEKLMELQERHEKNQARKAFDEAMAAAKAEIPTITKNRKVDYTTEKGGRTNYSYEDLATISETVTPILAKHGLSYRFRTSSPPNEPVTVTCVISHRLGYSEENTLQGPRDESGKKNGIQAIGSTLTYLQRMTLKASLGLAAAADDDGKSSESADAPITDEQLASLRALVEKSGTDIEKFCAYLKIEALPDLLQSQFENARVALEAKAKAKTRKPAPPKTEAAQ